MADRETELMSQAEYAEHRRALGLPGGTREAVRKAVDDGRISTIGGKIHPLIADAEWLKNTRARLSPQASAALHSKGAGGDAAEDSPPAAPAPAPTQPPAPPRDDDYNAFRTRREKAEAEDREIELQKKKGLLVQRADIDRAFFEIMREVRDRLAATGKRIAAEVSSLTSAEACETVIEREHRIAIELLVNSFREKVGTPPKGVAE